MNTSHPAGTTYYGSRAEARMNRGSSERIVRLGTFSAGSFGIYPPIRENGLARGQVSGGPMPSVVVWAVMSRE